MSTNSDDHTLVKHNVYQEIEADRTAVINTDDTVQTSGPQTQGTAPTPASTNNEATIITVPSPIPTSAEPRTTSLFYCTDDTVQTTGMYLPKAERQWTTG